MVIQMPEGEIIRRAIQWISEQRESVQQLPLIELIDEAGKKFDLSPKDCDFLIRFFTGPKEKSE